MKTPAKMFAVVALAALGLTAAVSDSKQHLVSSAERGDFVAVKHHLADGADPNALAPDGSTALHWAAELDDVEMARTLLRAGAEVSRRNRFGVAPMLLAARNGSAEMVDLLLKAGANPDEALPEGETALMRAARAGVSKTVRLLLEAGADPLAREEWRGQTALMWAAAEGHADAVKALVEAGVPVDARSDGGFSALLFAARQGRMEVVPVLVEAGADLNQTLKKVVEPGWGNQPRRTRLGGPTALDLAVTNAHYDLAAMLLEAGADPNIAEQGWTPLHTITWVRKPGRGSNDPPPAGSGSLDSLSMVRKLIEHGADINARMTSARPVGRSSLNSEGATPFLLAARTADAELMRLLAKLGADPLLPNLDGTTPLMAAAGVGTRAPTEDAGTNHEVVEAIKAALDLGGDPNAVDANGDTVMHGVAYKHVPAAVAVLAENGAAPTVWNRKNSHGWTPLRIAVGVHRGMNFRSSPETAQEIQKLLLKAGMSTEVEPEPVISGATR